MTTITAEKLKEYVKAHNFEGPTLLSPLLLKAVQALNDEDNHWHSPGTDPGRNICTACEALKEIADELEKR